MKRLWGSILCAAVLAVLQGCSVDDDDRGSDVPSYVTDLIELHSDHEGVLYKASLDNGESYDVQSSQLRAEVTDTTYRCLATYTLDGGEMKLYGLKSVFSQRPLTIKELLTADDGTVVPDTLPRDPVKVVSLWNSGGYVNMQLGILTTGGLHAYAFCQDGLGHYSLVHLRQAGDAESYTEKVYLSMPIPDGVEHFSFSIYTYDGVYTREF